MRHFGTHCPTYYGGVEMTADIEKFVWGARGMPASTDRPETLQRGRFDRDFFRLVLDSKKGELYHRHHDDSV